MMKLFSACFTPLPSSPTRGEVPLGARGTFEPIEPDHTLPLVGRVGEGVLSRLGSQP